MTRPRILMADDHLILLEAFKALLEPAFEIVGTVTDGRTLLDYGMGLRAVTLGYADERINRALLRLKPNHRQCLILSDVEDMSAFQIGEVMGMSSGAVRVLLCRARGEMRRLLAAEGLVR